MLKWAVGQRIPSSASSTCSDITTNATACYSPIFGKPSFPVHNSNHSTVRAAYVRNLKAVDKENRKKCRRSLKKEITDSSLTIPTRCRDNIYMHIEGVPSALRDVSNHWSPGGIDNGVDNERKAIKRKHIRLKKDLAKSNDKCSTSSHLTFVTAEYKKNENDRSPSINVTESKDYKYSVENPLPLPVPIQYGSSSNLKSILFNNNQYFTIQMWPPEEPDELFHKELPVAQLKTSSKFCDKGNCQNGATFVVQDEHICDKNPTSESTMMENLPWLSLNSIQRDNSEIPTLELSESFNSPNFALMLSETNSPEISLEKNTPRRSLKRKHENNLTYVVGNPTMNHETMDNNEGVQSKRRCVIFNETSLAFASPLKSDKSRSSQQQSALKRQKSIRRRREHNYTCIPQKIYNSNFKSALILPPGIPSPFQINDNQFRILSRTPLAISTTICDTATILRDDESDFSIMKKAMSTPKPGCPFDLTEDVFLSPGTRPLFDSVILRTTYSNPILPIISQHKKELSNFYTSPLIEQTWNSHGQILLKNDQSEDNERPECEENSTQNSTSSNSSRINDDQDGFSSIVSSTPTLVSPSIPIVDRTQPRTRRCLSFVSPSLPKNAVKSKSIETGLLDLRLYYNNGLLTVHIIRARKLDKIVRDSICNAYVKVNLIPQGVTKTFHRTCVRKNSFNPKFDHKFSMEISESDLTKRVIISTWHRDRGKKKSEFLGAMSFAVKNILKKEINGSYKLLSQSSDKTFITQNHPPLDLGGKTFTFDEKPQCSTIMLHKQKGQDDYMFLQCLELESYETDLSESEFRKSGRTPYTSTFKLTTESNTDLGILLTRTKPPRIERIDADSLAEKAGLKQDDIIVFMDEVNVVNSSQEDIQEIIQNCGDVLVLEIYRKPVVNVNDQFSTLSSTLQSINKKSIYSEENKIIPTNTNLDTISTNNPSNIRLQLPKVAFSSDVGSGILV